MNTRDYPLIIHSVRSVYQLLRRMLIKLHLKESYGEQ